MEKIISIVILFLCATKFCDSATLKLEHEPMAQSQHGGADLAYSDASNAQQLEARERLYRQLRQYGVPSDVAQMYVPRGMTLGELLGKDTARPPQHSDDHDGGADDDESTSSFDPWSIVWYIGSFGGLIAFFLVISCSEWCCLKSRAAATLAAATAAASTLPTPRAPRCTRHNTTAAAPNTPPPGYHLFAPPSYDDVTEREEKRRFDVYVVPVHAVPEVRRGCLEPVPPPYYTQIT